MTGKQLIGNAVLAGLMWAGLILLFSWLIGG